MIFIIKDVVKGELNVGGLFSTLIEKEQVKEFPHQGPTDSVAVIVYVAALLSGYYGQFAVTTLVTLLYETH
jgi:hypothetical protein